MCGGWLVGMWMDACMQTGYQVTRPGPIVFVFFCCVIFSLVTIFHTYSDFLQETEPQYFFHLL